MRPNWWHGWRLPKRGHWRLEFPRLVDLVAPPPFFTWKLGAILGTVAWWMLPRRWVWRLFAMSVVMHTVPAPPGLGAVGGPGAQGGLIPPWTSTLVVTTPPTGVTKEAWITATVARAAALGYLYVWVPQSMLPYTASSVTFNTGVRMICEGWDPSQFNILAYGADPFAVLDATAAVNAAIAGATASAQAGANKLVAVTVFCPSGTYAISGLIAFTPLTNVNIEFLGEHKRTTLFAITTTLTPAFRWGSATRDPSGTSNNVTNYGKLANFQIVANAPAAASTLLDIIEADSLVVDCVDLQNATTGFGMRILGSITSGGVNAASGPQAHRNSYYNCKVNNCLHPLYIENGEENDFFHCEYWLPKGVIQAADSLFCIEIKQGVMNRFYGTLCEGDPANRGSYIGVKFDIAVQGNVSQNQFYGLICEGHDIGVFNEDVNTVGNTVFGYTSSLNNTPWKNTNVAAGTNPSNQFHIDQIALTDYVAKPVARSPVGTVAALSAGLNSPSVAAGNIFEFVGNGGGSTIATFTGGLDGQFIWVRLDPNITLIDQSQGGGNDLFLWGRQNIVGETNMWVMLFRDGGGSTWTQVAPPIMRGGAVGGVLSVPYAMGSPLATLTYSATISLNATLGNSFIVTPTDGVAFTINIAASGSDSLYQNGQMMTLTVKNTFGVLGALTFGTRFKIGAAWVQPANGFSRSITFRWDGTNFVEIGRTAADVAN